MNLFQFDRFASSVEWIGIEHELELIEKFVRYLRQVFLIVCRP